MAYNLLACVAALPFLVVRVLQAALNSGDVTVADLEFEGVQIQPRKSWVDSAEVKAAVRCVRAWLVAVV